MAGCDYCSAAFEDDEAYLEHLRDEHGDELSRIDERRVREAFETEGRSPTRVAAIGAVGFLVLVAVYAVVTLGGGSTPAPMTDDVAQPHGLQSVHYHGQMDVVIGGSELDFSQPKYQLRADPFHFESRDGEQYHVHARNVTLEYALESLGIGVTDSTLSFDGEVYDGRSANVTVSYQVNGQDVNPERYVLRRGDTVRVVAERTGE